MSNFLYRAALLLVACVAAFGSVTAPYVMGRLLTERAYILQSAQCPHGESAMLGRLLTPGEECHPGVPLPAAPPERDLKF